MQLQQLIYFVTVAEQGSINKAAEKLFITQPNLSKAISNLENELKVRVFNRTNKGVALTDGSKLYQYARTILNQMELIQGLSQKDRPRTLSIAAYPIITMGCGWWRSSTTPTGRTPSRSSWWSSGCRT
ncbi:MAG: LysR family transcriptional regulator [Butyricicoccus sp.]